MLNKVRLVIAAFAGLALVVGMATSDGGMVRDALALALFAGFLGLFNRSRGSSAPGSCTMCRGTGRWVMPGNINNGRPCKH